MIIGTSHFPSVKLAINYYRPYFGPAARTEVYRKIAEHEIGIGPPPVKEGEKIVLLDNGRRYGVESK